MAVTMCHYMKSVKKSRTSKQGIPKTTKATLYEKSHKSHSMNSRTPLGLFGTLPREMRFGIFGFTLPPDLGQLSLTSREFRDEIMEYIHNNDALIIIVPKINQNSDEDSSELFITLETEYCCNHFKDLGNNFDAVTHISIIFFSTCEAYNKQDSLLFTCRYLAKESNLPFFNQREVKRSRNHSR